METTSKNWNRWENWTCCQSCRLWHWTVIPSKRSKATDCTCWVWCTRTLSNLRDLTRSSFQRTNLMLSLCGTRSYSSSTTFCQIQRWLTKTKRSSRFCSWSTWRGSSQQSQLESHHPRTKRKMVEPNDQFNLMHPYRTTWKLKWTFS